MEAAVGMAAPVVKAGAEVTVFMAQTGAMVVTAGMGRMAASAGLTRLPGITGAMAAMGPTVYWVQTAHLGAVAVIAVLVELVVLRGPVALLQGRV